MNPPVSGRENRPNISSTWIYSVLSPSHSKAERDVWGLQCCTWNCSFCLLPGAWARKRTWLKNARSHLTESCIPVLAVKRILKLGCESHGQSICRWRRGRRRCLEQPGPASSLLAGMEVPGPSRRAVCRKPGLGAPPRGVTAGAGGSPPRQKLL